MKKIFLIGLILLVIPTIFAFTATIESPSASESVSGNTLLNVTIASLGDGNGQVACAYYARATNTGNSSYGMIVNATNTTGGADIVGVNTTYLTALNLQDSDLWSIYADCQNSTDTVTTSAVTFTVDNTNPEVTSLSPSDGSTDADGTVTFTISAPSANSTGGTLHFTNNHPGSKAYTLTEGTDQFTVSLTRMPEGRYEWYATLTDGTDTTTSATYEMIVDDGGSSNRKVGAISALVQSEGGTQLSSRTFSIGGYTIKDKLSDFGNTLTKTKWGPFAPIVWIIAIIVIGFIVYKANKK